jgi:hypothetical protein
MKVRTFLVLVALCFAGCSSARHQGVFSNNAEGFYVKTLIIHENGNAIYFAGTGAIPVTWHEGHGSRTIVIDSAKFAMQFEIQFNEDYSELVILDEEIAEGSGQLVLQSREIPEKTREVLESETFQH